MATYYGYADRTASSEVNWAEIGQNVTDMLKEESRIREEKKAAIDEASRQFGKTLAEAPIGENTGINGVVTNYANDASQMMLMQDRLLKSGMLKLNQYTLARQNLTDGTNRLFDLSKEWQTIYAEKMERAQAGGLGSGIEQDDMESMEGLAKLANTKIFINPTNGMITVAKTKKVMRDGVEVEEMDTNPSNYNSINELNNFLKKKTDKFDVDAAVNTKVKLVADWATSALKSPGRGKAGSIAEVMDARNNPEYKAFITKTIDSLLVNDTAKASVLRDHAVNPTTGEEYFTTFDPEVAKNNPNAILKVKDGNGGYKFEFTKEQNDVAREYVQNQLEMQVKHVEEKASVAAVQDYHMTDTEASMQIKKQNADLLGQNVANAIYGNTEDLQNQGIRGLAGLGNIKYATKQGNTLYIYTDKNEPMAYTLTNDNKNDVFNQIIQGVAEQAGATNYIDPVFAKKRALEYTNQKGYKNVGTFNVASTDRRPKTTETKTTGTFDASQYNKQPQ